MPKWTRGLFPALVLVAGAAVYWGKVAQRDAAESEAITNLARPTIVGMPAVRIDPTPAVAANPPASVPAAPTKDVTAVVDTELAKLADLPSDDQPGLDQLFAKMKDLIRGHEAAYVGEFRKRMKHADTAGVKESFFLVKALVDNVTDPTAPLKELFTMRAELPKDADPHHELPRVNLVKTFAIEQWAASTPSGKGDRELLPVLLDLAKHDPDLSVARQAVLAINKRKLADDPVAFLREIRASRTPEEQFAFEGL